MQTFLQGNVKKDIVDMFLILTNEAETEKSQTHFYSCVNLHTGNVCNN